MGTGVFNPSRTAWHITIGTYCSRLHGGSRATVEREHNQPGERFVARDEDRERRERERALGEPVLLTAAQRESIERIIPEVCARGGWTFHACAAPPSPENDHFHVLLDADPAIHGKEIRRWLKRWVTEALDAEFGRPEGGRWWVEEGSTRPVKGRPYFGNVFEYVRKQRTTRCDDRVGCKR